MKNIILVAIITFVFSALFSATPVFAQTNTLTDKTTTPELTSVSEELDYTLPYPGILSDNPLYVFKNLRDRIMRMFLSDPVKRIEFSLLQSDKFLSMAMAYADVKKWDRAGKAIIDSQKEMEQAITEVIAARATGVIIPSHIIISLERSTVKHKQRADDMKKSSQENPDGLFGKASDVFTQLAAQASGLREQ